MLHSRLNGRQRVLSAVVFTVIACTAIVWLAPQNSTFRDTLGNLRPSRGSCASTKEAEAAEREWEAQFKTGRALPETTRPVLGSYGFYMFDNIYVWNGTFYIVTSQNVAEAFPPRNHILSRPVSMADPDLEPTDAELQFITPQRAQELFKRPPVPMSGTSMIMTEVSQFMNHFYHWWGETFLGAWRIYSTLAYHPTSGESSISAKYPDVFSIPFPKRFILPAAKGTSWRDPARVSAPLMFAAFPSAPVIPGDWWDDISRAGAPVVFERVLLSNRVAAHLHPNGMKWFKMIASAMAVEAPLHFFEPVRQSIVKTLVGQSSGSAPEGRPIVTYVSRQSSGRRLDSKSHESLVAALRELESEGVCDLHIADMGRMTIAEQIEVSSRSTIMLGVHGNGLTHQLWMPPSDKSTVIEIFFPPGWAYDYEMLARNMGHQHYAIWNDTYVTYPEGHPPEGGVFVPEGFHGSSIPAHGPAIADIIRRRLSLGPRAEDGRENRKLES